MKRSDFPALASIAYLDNAATTQKPTQVIKAMTAYMEAAGNVHRSIHPWGERATVAYENARARIASFFRTRSDQVVFTSGTTHALNSAARMLEPFVQPNDEIVVTEMDHHSNIVPWQELARRRKATIYLVPVDPTRPLKAEDFKEFLTGQTRIVAFPYVSNVLGTVNDAQGICAAAKAAGAYVVVDGAQAAPHIPVDLEALGADFFACSAHKMYGPPGIGMLWIRRILLDEMSPVDFGGEMIRAVFADRSTWNDPPWRFEAGTPNIVGAIGFGAAVEYLARCGMETVMKHEHELLQYLDSRLKDKGIVRFGTNKEHVGVASFVIPDVHAHDVAQVLADRNVAVRAGHACAMPLMRRLGVPAVVRASIALYTNKQDIDRFIEGLIEVRTVLA